MTSSLLAIAMLLAAPDHMKESRSAFARCLNQFEQSNLSKKTPPDEFDGQLSSACTTEENAFRKAVVAAETGRGVSRKTSEQGVADEVADYRSVTKETYRSEFAAAAKTN